MGLVETFAQQKQPPSTIPLPKISLNVDKAQGSEDYVMTLQILAVMTVLSLAPSILIMMTCFTRIVIVFHFLKQALGIQSQPPSQMITGLALFLTFFVMQPVLNQANAEGIQPYLREEITQEQAVDRVVKPFRTFMLKHTREEDLGLFIKLSGQDKPNDINDVSTLTIIPAYSISELRIAFQIGFLLFVPFLVLDMIIASTLMSLGMFLLPPQLISLPIKILLFILVDGWYLIIDSLMKSIMGP
jgi:flagellar biosynthetic protein FliP